MAHGSVWNALSPSQAPEERNYHIFYCMLMGMSAEDKQLLSLGTPSKYHYLTMVSCPPAASSSQWKGGKRAGAASPSVTAAEKPSAGQAPEAGLVPFPSTRQPFCAGNHLVRVPPASHHMYPMPQAGPHLPLVPTG